MWSIEIRAGTSPLQPPLSSDPTSDPHPFPKALEEGYRRVLVFPKPSDRSEPLTLFLASKWLKEAENLAGVEPQEGSLWHAYRRKWVTERKHFPDVDVAAAGGWKNTVSLKTAYQQADSETILKVVMEAGELREVR